MRKLFTALLIPLTIIIAASCSNDNDDQNVNVAAGFVIYEAVYSQRILDKDPAYVAFRLNVLLTTVAESEDVNATIDNLKVKVKGKGENETEKEVLLKEHLFAKNTLTDQGNGVWKIEFKADVVGELDYDRSGTITVNTQGKMLQELESGEVWIVEADNYQLTGNNSNYTNKFKNYYIEGAPEIIPYDGGGDPVVLPTRSWRIAGTYEGYMTGGSAAKWNFWYDIEQSAGGTQAFEDVIRSDFEVTGEGEGYSLASDIKVEYRAVNLKYRLSCREWWVYGGAEYATMDETFLDKESFPSNKVKYLWETQNDKCDPAVTVGYAGFTSLFPNPAVAPKEQL